MSYEKFLQEDENDHPKIDHAKNLDVASGIIFFLGMLSSKLSFLPIAIVSGIGYLLSLSFYLLGYLLWMSASYFYPEHPPLEGHWTGRFQFRDQSKLSACFGGVAVIFAFLTFVFPWAVLPSIWLFFLSNLVWSISHYQKLKNPQPDEDQHSKENQSKFLKYTIATTIISLLTAACLTVSFFFPPVAPILLLVSTGFGLALTIAAMCYFLHYHVAMNLAVRKEGKNYSDISHGLSNDPGVGIGQNMNASPTARIGRINEEGDDEEEAIDLNNSSSLERTGSDSSDPSDDFFYRLSSHSSTTKIQVEALNEVDNLDPDGYTTPFIC